MFLRFYTGEKASLQAEEFADKVMSFDKNVSPAQIQGFFMFFKHAEPEEVLKNCNLIWEL